MACKNPKLKELEIVFENCEVYTIPAKDIRVLSIEHITSDILINGFQFEDGEEHKYVNCDYVYLALRESAFKIVNLISEIPLRDRLEYKDITYLNLIYYNKNKDICIGVPWNGEDFSNNYQKNNVTKDEDNNDILEVTITETE